MLKLLGAVMLTCGAAALGFSAAGRLVGRVRGLRAVLGALELMDRELSFRLTPVPELLTILAERAGDPARAFFARCCGLLTNLGAYTLGQIWRTALEEIPMSLSQDDLRALGELGEILGRYDGEGQREAVGGIRAQLQHNLQAAEEESHRMGRVYGALGLAVGSFLVILLF